MREDLWSIIPRKHVGFEELFFFFFFEKGVCCQLLKGGAKVYRQALLRRSVTKSNQGIAKA